jgi:hypothetical protein
MADAEGYGYRGDEQGLDRLLSDARTLSPAGIERAAWGWDRHEDPRIMQRFHEAERAALHALEKNNRMQQWDDARKRILDLTEGRTSLEDWKAEHGDIGHKGERALLAAALAILARDKIEHAQYVTLVRPMSEALPWLLPELVPEPRR